MYCYCKATGRLTTGTIGINGKIMIKESSVLASLIKHNSSHIEGNSNNYTGAFSIPSCSMYDYETVATETGVSYLGDTKEPADTV